MTTPKKKLEKSLKTKDSDSKLEKKSNSLLDSISNLESKLSCAKIDGDKTQIDNLVKMINRLKSMRKLYG